MDIDLSDSDMSRFTTMLLTVGCAFERSYAAAGIRCVDVGGVTFEFSQAGTLMHVSRHGEPLSSGLAVEDADDS